ncbi:hypothetical protein BC827DRAFT_1314471 [Russula dissimulans]|nr:hypothetical protein BC827DRAFT_1314471 [Russula dissimulans]
MDVLNLCAHSSSNCLFVPTFHYWTTGPMEEKAALTIARGASMAGIRRNPTECEVIDYRGMVLRRRIGHASEARVTKGIELFDGVDVTEESRFDSKNIDDGRVD